MALADLCAHPLHSADQRRNEARGRRCNPTPPSIEVGSRHSELWSTKARAKGHKDTIRSAGNL